MRRLFIFPYAGGSCWSFNKWKRNITNLEIVALDYPGHGSRYGEKYANTIQEIAEQFVELLIIKTINENDILFGHSMGGIVCWHVAKILQEQHGINIKDICISSCVSPKEFRHDCGTLLPRKQFIEKLVRDGHITREIVDNAIFENIFLPTIYADYKMIENYEYYNDNILLMSRVNIFCATFDYDNTMEKMNKWNQLFAFRGIIKEFEGNHFYFDDEGNCALLCDLLAEIE